MRPTDDLKNEHEAVLVMLSILGKVAERLEQKAVVPQEHFGQVLEFLRGFVDKCHHGKEETALFPAMEGAGVPKDGGPIGVMLAEHEAGRGFVRQMAASVGKDDRAFARATQGYVGLLRQHIAKENGVLFPMADKVLSAETQVRLEHEFEEIEEKVVGAGKHEQYHTMLHSLKAFYGA